MKRPFPGGESTQERIAVRSKVIKSGAAIEIYISGVSQTMRDADGNEMAMDMHRRKGKWR